MSVVPSWLAWARAEHGTKEIVGPEHNDRILQYWLMGRVALKVSDDETPWCAAFVNAALVQTGFDGTKSGRARSFQPGPNFITCDERIGAIAVFSSSRGPASGHVGFVEEVGDTQIWVTGGNQGNRVCVAPFPRARLLVLLWPKNAVSYLKYPMAPRNARSGQGVSDG